MFCLTIKYIFEKKKRKIIQYYYDIEFLKIERLHLHIKLFMGLKVQLDLKLQLGWKVHLVYYLLKLVIVNKPHPNQ